MTKLRVEGVLLESERSVIHQSAITLLEKLGFMCNHPGILEAFQQAGCKIGEALTKPKGARIVTFTEEIISDGDLENHKWLLGEINTRSDNGEKVKLN